MNPFRFRRTTQALNAAQDQNDTLRRALNLSRETNARDRAADTKATADLVDRLTTRYYAASALVALSFKTGDGNSHQIGVMDGLIRAISEVTGINTITVGYKMSHGIPVTSNWIAVNDHPSPLDNDIRLLHDGIREPIQDRLDHLHQQALTATGHPLAKSFSSLNRDCVPA